MPGSFHPWQFQGWTPPTKERTGASAGTGPRGGAGLSPRNVRLATGSLRRSFFALGRLLALTSRQHNMAGALGALSRASSWPGHWPLTEGASGQRWAPRGRPKRRLCPPQRLGGGRSGPPRGSPGEDTGHPLGGSALSSGRGGARTRAVGPLVPSSEGRRPSAPGLQTRLLRGAQLGG